MGKPPFQINENFDETTFDVPDIPSWEGQLNPEQHIHFCMLSLNKMLTHEKPEVGFMQYAGMVRHIEAIAKAAHKLPDKYDETMKANLIEFKKQTDKEYLALFWLAQEKLTVIMESFFAGIPLKTAGKV